MLNVDKQSFFTNLVQLSNCLKVLGVKKLLIVIVYDDIDFPELGIDERTVNMKYDDGKIKIEVIQLSYSFFRRLFLFNSGIIYVGIIYVGASIAYTPSQILYIFNIREKLLLMSINNDLNTLITGGLNSKRHITYKLNARHSNYLLAFFNLNVKRFNDYISDTFPDEVSSVFNSKSKDLKLSKQDRIFERVLKSRKSILQYIELMKEKVLCIILCFMVKRNFTLLVLT